MKSATTAVTMVNLTLAASFILGGASGLAQEIAMPLPADELIARQDKKILNSQAAALFKSWDTVSGKAGASTVKIFSGNKQVALGIVVATGKVLTKYSDLKKAPMLLSVIDASGRIHDMRPVAAVPEHDLVILDVPGMDVVPLDFNLFVDGHEGDMVAAVSPGGLVTDFGVISVDQRSLREEDTPYLGLVADPSWEGRGARIAGVERGSGAHASGMLPGDVLLQLNGFLLDGIFSLRTALQKVNPGEEIPFLLERDGKKMQGTIKTARRPRVAKFPQKRLEQMNSMGNRMNARRSDFPLVFQTDMTMVPESAGCPVINLDGKIVGMALSRAGRTETYILPSWVIRDLVQGVLPRIDRERDARRGEEVPMAEPIDESSGSSGDVGSQHSPLENTLRAIQEAMRRQGYQPKDY